MEAPPPDVLAWAETVLDDRIVAARAMVGGIDAKMFRVSTVGGPDVVLRIASGGEWDDIEHQAGLLDLLAPTDVPAPIALGIGRAIGGAGHPVLLQTLLDGDPSLPLEPMQAWLRSLVETNVGIQSVPADPSLPDRLRDHWDKLSEFDDERATGLERRLLEILWRREPDGRRVLGHNDYWVGNTLREGDRVVGIVDWGGAGRVSPARDITYCAVDMSLCYGLEYGDQLVRIFRDLIDVDDTEVDLWAARAVISSRWFPEWLAGWNGLGVPVTHEQAARRRTELLERTLARLG